MSYEFNHTYCFVEEGFPQEEAFREVGFGFTFFDHKGQGTAAKFILFEKNYLEFIWVNDPETASQTGFVHQQRFDSKKTGYCPFGIALSGTPDESFGEFDVYSPPYFKSGSKILQDRSAVRNPKGPAVFFMKPPEGRTYEMFRPESYPPEYTKDLLCRDREIARIEYHGPGLEIPEYVKREKLLSFHESDHYQMKVFVSGGAKFEPIHAGFFTMICE